jgi:hypothetical protein
MRCKKQSLPEDGVDKTPKHNGVKKWLAYKFYINFLLIKVMWNMMHDVQNIKTVIYMCARYIIYSVYRKYAY